MTIFGQNESPGLCCYGNNPLYLLITMQTGCTMSELWPPITQDVLIHSHINISLDTPQNVGICMGVNGKIFGGHNTDAIYLQIKTVSYMYQQWYWYKT